MSNKTLQREFVSLKLLHLIKLCVSGFIDQLFWIGLLVLDQRPSCSLDLSYSLLHREVLDRLNQKLAFVDSVIGILDVDHLSFWLSNTHERSLHH